MKEIDPMQRYTSHAKTFFITLLLALTFTANSYAKTVLVTGSNRGIGLEFVTQYAAVGWDVIATSRSGYWACTGP